MGQRVRRVDGSIKVTGEALYTDDLFLPGMLCGKILRSPYSHARILNIDKSKAERLPGVKAVIAGKDTPGRRYGVRPTLDQYPLAIDKVRYIGDEVAAVAAISEDVAEEALDLIKVEYEELPAVFDVEEAMRPDAPKLHGEETNIVGKTDISYGYVEKGFSESDYVREDRFTTSEQSHGQIEPHAILAEWDSSGRLTCWVTNAGPFTIRRSLSTGLGIPESKVRLCKAYVGGHFGGKAEAFSLYFCAAILSQKSGKPVKIVHTREENFFGTRLRRAHIIDLKTGVKKDGTLVARKCRVITDTGAYGGTGLMGTWLTSDMLLLVYRVPNFSYEGYPVYTNKPVGGPCRGFGEVQARFADEIQMDIIAEELGLDPLEIRLKNARESGDILPTSGKVITSCGLAECFRKVTEASGWNKKRGKRLNNRGIGIAATVSHVWQNFGPMSHCAAMVKMSEDGRMTVLVGAIETGSGTETTLAQIAAEEMGLPFEDIEIITGDTELPQDIGGYLMGATFGSGNAVKAAVADARTQLFKVAAERLQVSIEDLKAKNRRIYVKWNPGKGMSIREANIASLMGGTPIQGRGTYSPPDSTRADFIKGGTKETGTYSFVVQATEVEVDKKTGVVKPVKTWLAMDVGQAINPLHVEGQIQGCIAHSQGMALTEKIVWENGKLLNPSFTDYRMPRSVDIAPVDPIIVESNDPDGPFGAKDAGEPPVHTGLGAIANAVYDAIGVRFKEVPITPENVLKALEEKKRRK